MNGLRRPVAESLVGASVWSVRGGPPRGACAVELRTPRGRVGQCARASFSSTRAGRTGGREIRVPTVRGPPAPRVDQGTGLVAFLPFMSGVTPPPGSKSLGGLRRRSGRAGSAPPVRRSLVRASTVEPPGRGPRKKQRTSQSFLPTDLRGCVKRAGDESSHKTILEAAQEKGPRGNLKQLVVYALYFACNVFFFPLLRFSYHLKTALLALFFLVL